MRFGLFIAAIALTAALVCAIPTAPRGQAGIPKAASRQAVAPGVLKTAVRQGKRGKRVRLPKSNSGDDDEEELQDDDDTVEQVSDDVEEEIEDAASEAREALDDAREELEDTFSCFPASATVQTPGRIPIRMEDLSVGDSIAVGPVDSRVFMFTHADRDGMHPFVRLTTSSGHALSLSGGHFLYANDVMMRADSVSVGDKLLLADGAASPVVDVRMTRERGLFNPQTLHGDIAVNGVVTSTYTAAVEPKVAHALLAPARIAFSWFGYSSALFNNGAPEGLKNLLLPIGSVAY